MHTSVRQSLIASTFLALTAIAASAAPAAPVVAPPAAAATTPTPAATPAATAAAAPAATAPTAAIPGVKPDFAGKVEQRIAALHTALAITAAQEPQWEAFALTMRDNAKTADTSFQQRVTGIAAMSAVDNMQSYADMSMQHAQGMQKMVPVFRTLYGELTAEQKKVADTEFVDRAHRGADKPKG